MPKQNYWTLVFALIISLGLAVGFLAFQPQPATALPLEQSANPVNQNWEWLTPLPQGGDIVTLSCVEDNICYALAEGGGFLTNRAGEWETLPTVITGTFNSLKCLAASTCLLAGENSTLLKTTDAGQSWQSSIITNGGNLQDLNCPSSQICYMRGWSSVFKTENAGQTWSVVYGGPANDLTCPTVTTCYGLIGSSLIVIQNGGQNWIYRNISIANALPYYNIIECLTENDCWLGSTYTSSVAAPTNNPNWSGLIRTVNAGVTWSKVYTGEFSINRLECSSLLICYAAEYKFGTNKLLKSTNGGQTWQDLKDTENFLVTATALDCTPNGCWVGGDTGFIGRTFVSSNFVTEQTLGGNRSYWRKADCPDPNVCYMIGGRYFKNEVLRTVYTDTSTVRIYSDDSTFGLYDISCVNTLTCYAVTQFDAVLKTSDGWLSWSSIPNSPTIGLVEIDCLTEQTCYARDNYKIYRTQNGGQSWTLRSPTISNTEELSTLTCVDVLTCYAGTFDLYKTTDGGQSWQIQNTGQITRSLTYAIREISCPDSQTCVAVRSYPSTSQYPFLNVHSTTDGGQTWRNLSINEYVWDVGCPNTQKCYIGGVNGKVVNFDIAAQTWLTETVTYLENYPRIECNQNCYYIVDNSVLRNGQPPICSPFVVRLENGATGCGSLVYALENAIPGATLRFDNSLSSALVFTLPQGINLKAGVSIDASNRCQSGGVTLRGSGANSGDGLTVNGGSLLSGLRIEGFSGRQLVLKSGGNVVKCTSVRSS
jgi:photosystem II stability/assembly factor-like uncharacterized protein